MKARLAFLTIFLLVVLISSFGQAKEENVKHSDVIYEQPTTRTFQMSFVPGFGTHIGNNNPVYNRISMNIIGGSNYGVRGAELGGVLNINKSNVKGSQLGGFMNLTGGMSTGAQLSGFINLNRGDVKGLQIAGFTNISSHNIVGTQMSGFYNLASDVKGAQIAGFLNTGQEVAGAQFAGFMNQSKSVNGLQIGGFYNGATEVKGVQTAGFMNLSTDDVSGLQLAGFLNIADTVRGVQIGIVNISKSVKKGISLGLINIVKDGLIHGEASYNDVTEYNLSFISGTRTFHTILSAGLGQNPDIWSFGAGFGTEFQLKNRLYTSISLTSHQLQSTERKIDALALDNRLGIIMGWKTSGRTSILAGPIVHYYFTDSKEDLLTQDIQQDAAVDRKSGKYTHKGWIGYQVAFRF